MRYLLAFLLLILPVSGEGAQIVGSLVNPNGAASNVTVSIKSLSTTTIISNQVVYAWPLDLTLTVTNGDLTTYPISLLPGFYRVTIGKESNIIGVGTNAGPFNIATLYTNIVPYAPYNPSYVTKDILTSKGDLFVHNGSQIIRHPAAADGHHIIYDSTSPDGLSDAMGGAGTVTNVAITSSTLTVVGSPITSGGTIAVEIPANTYQPLTTGSAQWAGTTTNLWMTLGQQAAFSNYVVGVFQPLNSTLTALSGVSATNQFVFQNDSKLTDARTPIYGSQSANAFLAGPTSGGATTPTFRAIVTGDLPSLASIYQPLATVLTQLSSITSSNQFVFANDTRLSNSRAPTGTAGGDLGDTYPNPTVVSVADVNTGTLAIANGGTGQATRQAAFDGLAPASPAQGTTLYYDGSHWVLLARGNTGDQLFTSNNIPVWLPPAASGGSNPVHASTTMTNQYGLSANNTWVTVTNLAVTITPSSTNSLIRVTVAAEFGTGGSANGGAFRILRNGSEIAPNTNPGSGKISAYPIANSPTQYSTMNVAQFDDNPATTSAVTYQVQIRGENTVTISVNGPQNLGSGQTYSFYGSSTIAALELK